MTTPAVTETNVSGADARGASGLVGLLKRLGGASAEEYWDTLRLRSLLWTTNLLVLSVLGLMVFPGVLEGILGKPPDRHLAIDGHFALLVLCACATPPLLARLCYSLINRRAASQQLFVAFPATLAPEQRERAASAWTYEIRRNRGSLTRAESFAGLWGLLTTLVLVGAVTFLLPPFHEPQKEFKGPHAMVAFAVVGAATTRFFLDLARMCVRISNEDASKRMFAETLRALVLSVVATLAVMLLWDQLKPLGKADAGVAGVLQAMGVGAGVAIVGVPAFEYVAQKIAGLLGISRPPQPAMTPLSALTGISVAEMDRLAEEGIDSVECLVSTPLPRIFLSTRFSLSRLCDWYDKGLLLCRVGASAAGELQSRAGVRGALEMMAVAVKGDAQKTKALEGTVRKAMRLESDEEAGLVVAAIVSDEAVAVLGALRQTQLAEPSAHDEDVATK